MLADLQLKRDAIAYKLRTRNKTIPWLVIGLNALFGLPFKIYRYITAEKNSTVDPMRIMVIRADRIGDMILAIPMFKQLKERYPQAAITCLASSLSGQLIAGNPFVDTIMTYDPAWFDRKKGGRGFNDYIRIWKLIKEQSFDMAIDLRGNYNNFFCLMFLTGISQRVSFNASLGAFLLTHEVHFEPGKHETAYFMDIVKHLGGKAAAKPQPVIVLTDKEEKSAADFFKSHKITPRDVLIAMHPGAGAKRIYKQWPQENYVELGRSLVEKYNAKLIITGSEAEVALATGIKNRIGKNAICAAGSITSLKDLAAVLRRCMVYISTNTGIMHLAAAVETPVIVLCGPEDSRRWQPLGDGHRLISKAVPCRPCREETCAYDGKCLSSIYPTEVLAAVQAYVG